MLTGLSDNDIISSVLAGDREVYARIVERYQSYVFTLVLRFTRSREDAEELSQDIFVKAYRALGSFKGQSK
ncbi:MAG: RNA polymerase subunit sigma, partial [Chitinophagaceae bacterium]